MSRGRDMDARVAARLLALNRAFYQAFGEAYAEKRGFEQPGMVRMLRLVPREATVVDVGCGHGRVISLLARQGFRGRYFGVDASPVLLRLAAERARAVEFPITLWERDIAQAEWAQGLPRADVVVSFSVLHHLPGRALRIRVLRDMAGLLIPRGWLGLSVWNLMRSPRRKARIQPWSQLGLHIREVEPGDLLMDWRHRGLAFRYIHQYTLPELENEARQAGLHLYEAFLDDGENRRLGLYARLYSSPSVEAGWR